MPLFLLGKALEYFRGKNLIESAVGRDPQPGSPDDWPGQGG
uniref:Uncharacterized protein n=1 Tax=Yersinia ruckeri TaxID=29486 RepID=A0A0A8VK54_YERRU|nr:hypothetical protein CSF007_14945 [Yersinia ruckeri]